MNLSCMNNQELANVAAQYLHDYDATMLPATRAFFKELLERLAPGKGVRHNVISSPVREAQEVSNARHIVG